MTNPKQPKLLIFGGVNGAGKTTLAYSMVPHITTIERFLNADNIARGLSPLAPEKVALRAGKILLQQIDELIEEQTTFAIETTLASKGHLKTIEKAQSKGFYCEMFYVWMPDVSYSHERVAMRVKKGGHPIPAKDIERRYQRSVNNFWHHYRMQVDEWRLYTNMHEKHDLLAFGKQNNYTVKSEELWKLATQNQPI
jgi:predicted ABC-type ATPase